MTKTRRIFGIVVVTGTLKTDKIIALPKDSKLVVLPPYSHIQRNPRKPILAWIERQDARDKEGT